MKTKFKWAYQSVILSNIVTEEPSYGSPSRAIPITKKTDIRYIRITDFGEDGIPSDNEYMTAEETRKEFILNKDDLLFARSGATVGKTYIHEDLSKEAIFAGYCIRFKIDPSKASPKFVYFFTKTEAYNYWIQRIQRPAGQPNINKEEFKSLEIPLPSLTIQNELCKQIEEAQVKKTITLAKAEELLKGLDEYILDKLDFVLPAKLRIQSYAITKSLLNNRIDSYSNQSHFRNLFDKLSERKYNSHSIKSITYRIISGSTPLSGGEAYIESPNGIRFIRSGEITPDGCVTPKSEIHIKEEIHRISLKRSQLKKNDVLIAIVGATIGQVGVYEFEDEANINQAIAAVSISDLEVLPQYLCWYLKSSLGQMILDYFKRPVARANINLDEIAQIPVIVPKKEIQQEIINEVNRRKEKANKLKAEAETEWQNAKKLFEEQLLEGVK